MSGAWSAAALAAFGALCVMAADVMRALRTSAGLKGVAGGIVDFLTAVSVCAVLWYALMRFVKGETRFCCWICFVTGAVIYIAALEKIIFKAFCIIFENIFKFFGLILKILLTPAHFLYKMLCVVLHIKRCDDGVDLDVKKGG